MIDFEKLNMMDLVFVDEPWTPEEKLEFSAFLKKRKEERLAKEKRRTSRGAIHNRSIRATAKAIKN